MNRGSSENMGRLLYIKGTIGVCEGDKGIGEEGRETGEEGGIGEEGKTGEEGNSGEEKKNNSDVGEVEESDISSNAGS